MQVQVLLVFQAFSKLGWAKPTIGAAAAPTKQLRCSVIGSTLKHGPLPTRPAPARTELEIVISLLMRQSGFESRRRSFSHCGVEQSVRVCKNCGGLELVAGRTLCRPCFRLYMTDWWRNNPDKVDAHRSRNPPRRKRLVTPDRRAKNREYSKKHYLNNRAKLIPPPQLCGVSPGHPFSAVERPRPH